MIIPFVRSQTQVAKILGITQGEVSKRERNAIRKLSKAFAHLGLTVETKREGLVVNG